MSKTWSETKGTFVLKLEIECAEKIREEGTLLKDENIEVCVKKEKKHQVYTVKPLRKPDYKWVNDGWVMFSFGKDKVLNDPKGKRIYIKRDLAIWVFGEQTKTYVLVSKRYESDRKKEVFCNEG